jgi:hypothetical protein
VAWLGRWGGPTLPVLVADFSDELTRRALRARQGGRPRWDCIAPPTLAAVGPARRCVASSSGQRATAPTPGPHVPAASRLPQSTAFWSSHGSRRVAEVFGDVDLLDAPAAGGGVDGTTSCRLAQRRDRRNPRRSRRTGHDHKAWRGAARLGKADLAGRCVSTPTPGRLLEQRNARDPSGGVREVRKLRESGIRLPRGRRTPCGARSATIAVPLSTQQPRSQRRRRECPWQRSNAHDLPHLEARYGRTSFDIGARVCGNQCCRAVPAGELLYARARVYFSR